MGPVVVPFPSMIRLDHVSRVYGTRAAPVRALDDVSLEIGPGVNAVVGPNGAGKTTLLGVVLGFLRPSAGRVSVGGRPPRRWIREHGAACLPERFRLPPEWTVAATFHALAALEGLQDAEATTRVEGVLNRLGLADDKDRALGTLSRGTVQRVGLAQALLADRELVVLDEPTEGLDPLWRVRFREIVGDLRRDGRTVLLASHELPEIERLADRAIVLRDGRVQEAVELAGAGGGPTRYRLELETGHAIVAEAFPDARIEGEGGAVQVVVADARELSDRLAALIARGAVVRAVTPAGAELEQRVRRGETPPGSPE